MTEQEEKELLAQFHHTISEQLNARLSESPKFFGLLIIVSTGYGYVLSSAQLEQHRGLFALASLLAYASVLWASWYLAALGYAFRFLQNIQHCIERKMGWDVYTPDPTVKPPCSEKSFSSTFWLLPGIYHAHAAGLGVLLVVICLAFEWYAWNLWHDYWQRCLVTYVGLSFLLVGLACIYGWNRHYLKKFCKKRRDPKKDSLSITQPGTQT